MSYIKEVISHVWFIAVFTCVHARKPSLVHANDGLEAKVDMLSAQMRQLEKQNSDMAKQYSELAEQNNELAMQNSDMGKQISDLEKKITNMQTKANSSTSLMFDCYLTSDWTEAGPIRFNGCEGKERSHYSIPKYYLSF